MQRPTKYVMIRMRTKPANTQPTAVGTTESTGSGFPPVLAKQTSAVKQRQESEVSLMVYKQHTSKQARHDLFLIKLNKNVFF